MSRSPKRRRTSQNQEARPADPGRRPIWSGYLSFGLVAIPVQLVPALAGPGQAFHWLHAKDHVRLKQTWVCAAEGETVEPGHLVRGVEVEPDRFIVVREPELEGLEPEHSQTLELGPFVDDTAIHPLYYHRPYYLLPAGTEKPYRLLAETLENRRKLGVGKFVLHGREYLAAVRAIAGRLCLFSLHYHQDLLPAEALAAGAEAGRAAEPLLARLAEVRPGTFDPDKYANPNRQRIQASAAEKQARRELVSAPVAELPEEEGEPVDLIAALEKSLAETKAPWTKPSSASTTKH